jgi:uncharacterized protein YdaU (DUF1376 family)
MGIVKWYKRDPRAALIGMMGLTATERGVYNTLLDLIYCHDGAVLDSHDEIAPWLGVSARVWKRIRLKLLDKGKLYVSGGYLRNERADEEIKKYQTFLQTSILSASKRWATYNEIKRLTNGYPMQPTTRKKESLSANIVPIAKRPSEVGRKELDEQFARRRGEPDSSRETPDPPA